MDEITKRQLELLAAAVYGEIDVKYGPLNLRGQQRMAFVANYEGANVASTLMRMRRANLIRFVMIPNHDGNPLARAMWIKNPMWVVRLTERGREVFDNMDKPWNE